MRTHATIVGLLSICVFHSSLAAADSGVVVRPYQKAYGPYGYRGNGAHPEYGSYDGTGYKYSNGLAFGGMSPAYVEQANEKGNPLPSGENGGVNVYNEGQVSYLKYNEEPETPYEPYSYENRGSYGPTVGYYGDQNSGYGADDYRGSPVSKFIKNIFDKLKCPTEKRKIKSLAGKLEKCEHENEELTAALTTCHDEIHKCEHENVVSAIAGKMLL